MDIPEAWGDKLYPASHFLGYRRGRQLPMDEPAFGRSWRKSPYVKKAENIVQSAVGAFVGLIALGLLSKGFKTHNVPVIIGSFGAEAILLYAAPTSPMAQPRNIILSTSISSAVGTGIAKLFAHQDPAGYPTQYVDNWAAAATAVTVSLIVTQILNVPHPPGGAAALLAATNQQIFSLGWFYVGYIMLGATIMLVWGLIVNNIGRRRYPQYWISPDLITDSHEAEREKLSKAPGSSRPEEQQG